MHTLLAGVLFLSICNGEDNDKDGPCYRNSKQPCLPCSPDEVMAGENDDIIHNNGHCYDSDPIQVPKVYTDLVTRSEIVLAPSLNSTWIKKYGLKFSKLSNLDPSYHKIQPSPLFIHATPTKNGKETNGKELDFGHTNHWYGRSTQEGKEDSDFQILDLPRRNNDNQKQFLEEFLTTGNSLGLIVMLEYLGETSKVLSYPCNQFEGINTKIIALLTDKDFRTSKSGGDVDNKLWISLGNSTFFGKSVYPLAVEIDILKLMSSGKRPECSLNHLKDLMKSKKKVYSLRTVHDFVFTKNRILFAMQCGILVFEHFSRPKFFSRAARLKTSVGIEAEFSDPITRIGASTCCGTNYRCLPGSHIVAAYSYRPDMDIFEPKFIYVSFDHGDVFVKKVISTMESALNIISSMYLIHQSEWEVYYRILAQKRSGSEDFLEIKELESLRNDPVWESLTIAEKELSLWKHESFVTPSKPYGETPVWPSISLVKQVKESLKVQKKILSEYAKEYQNKFPKHVTDEALSKTPDWIKLWQKAQQTHFTETDSFDDETYVLDSIVGYLMEKKLKVLKKRVQDTFCAEIVSLLVEEEQESIRILCRIGSIQTDDRTKNHRKDKPKPQNDAKSKNSYSVYYLKLKEELPFAIEYRYSQRSMQCEPIVNDLFPHPITVRPSLYSVGGSNQVIMSNCKGAIYYSTDKGRNWLNGVFYEKSKQGDYYIRNFITEQLSVPPLFATNNKETELLLTFRDYYGYGLLTLNEEFRISIGKTLKVAETNLEKLNILISMTIPLFTDSGEPKIYIPLAPLYSSVSPYKEIYEETHGLRLIEVPHSIKLDHVPYFWENTRKKDENLDFLWGSCTTGQMSVDPKEIELDVGESEKIHVTIIDKKEKLPLFISASLEPSLEIKVHNQRKNYMLENELVKHEWDIQVTIKPILKSQHEMFIDAFFGTDYSKFVTEPASLLISTIQNPRCHVKASVRVSAATKCADKNIISYEDEYRPQCLGQFYKNFKYTLRRGQFDPEMVEYWKNLDKENEFFTLLPNGDLEVLYDHATFGCPVEPYPFGYFNPNIRIQNYHHDHFYNPFHGFLDEDEKELKARKKGTPFKGRYVLIEIFGAKGFSYKKTIRDAGCNRWPQNLTYMKEQWMTRKLMFHTQALKRNLVDLSLSDIKYPQNVTGNPILNVPGIRNPANIWNPANYIPCDSPLNPGEEPATFTEAELNRPYEIMGEDTGNELFWDLNTHQRVYIFMVMVLDQHKTICEFHSMFGVSVLPHSNSKAIWSIITFFSCCILWCIVLVACYIWRKANIRGNFSEEIKKQYLMEAAWTIIYRYEKELHDAKNKNVQKEIEQNKRQTLRFLQKFKMPK